MLVFQGVFNYIHAYTLPIIAYLQTCQSYIDCIIDLYKYIVITYCIAYIF